MTTAILTTIRPKARKVSMAIHCRERGEPYNTYSLESKALINDDMLRRPNRDRGMAAKMTVGRVFKVLFLLGTGTRNDYIFIHPLGYSRNRYGPAIE